MAEEGGGSYAEGELSDGDYELRGVIAFDIVGIQILALVFEEPFTITFVWR